CYRNWGSLCFRFRSAPTPCYLEWINPGEPRSPMGRKMSSSTTGVTLSEKVGARAVAAGAIQPVSATSDAEDRAGQHSADTGARREDTKKWALLALVAVGTFMTTLDSSI